MPWSHLHPSRLKMSFQLAILLAFLSLFTVVISKTAEDEVKDIDISSDSSIHKNFTSHDNTIAPRPQTSVSASSSSLPKQVTPYECKDLNVDISSCSSGEVCSSLGGNCIVCDFNCSCIYGQVLNVSCAPSKGVVCTGSQSFMKQMICRYCYQTPSWEHNCSGTAECPAVSSPRKMFKSNCSVKSDVICMGNRSFPKRLPCNWTSGYQWSTALILSITLGGFGADRFYLGHWQEGIGKLFSFGGLGVWTIIDVILIAIHYLGPANESLYI